MKRITSLSAFALTLAMTSTLLAADWPMWGNINGNGTAKNGRNGKYAEPAPPVYLPGASAPAQETTNQVFWFGHFAFNQAYTPNIYTTLAPGTYSYAEITEHPISVTKGIREFPSQSVGFDASLSVGELFAGGMGTGGARALNLRGGSIESPARSGFTLSWSNGVMVTNQPGVAEFVVYESGGFGGPEAYMVQVHIEGTAIWSDWVYQTESNFTPYRGRATEGAYATVFDLDMFGLREGERIDSIRIVSMNSRDRMRDASGVGIVIPEDVGKTSSHLPDPGRTAVFRTYDISSLDADILYVGVLHNPVPTASLANTSGGGR